MTMNVGSLSIFRPPRVRRPLVLGLGDAEVLGPEKGRVGEIEDLEEGADVGHAVRTPAAEIDLDHDLAPETAELVDGFGRRLVRSDEVDPGGDLFEDGLAADGTEDLLAGREAGEKGKINEDDEDGESRLAQSAPRGPRGG